LWVLLAGRLKNARHFLGCIRIGVHLRSSAANISLHSSDDPLRLADGRNLEDAGDHEKEYMAADERG
jgi:hypothetical protein